MPTPPAPLFTDPVYDGINDPTLVWNERTSEWWCIFAHRRANVRLSAPTIGLAHGTPLGVATSTDHGASWLYRGTLDLPIEPGHNTFWGPTVVTVEGVHHLFTTFIRGVPNDPTWDTHGRPSPWARQVHHLTSTDLWNWTWHGRVDLGTDHGHDACVARMPDGTWSLWFKDEAAGGALHRVTSPDLESWSDRSLVLPEWHESPIVFQLGGYYWLVAESPCRSHLLPVAGCRGLGERPVRSSPRRAPARPTPARSGRRTSYRSRTALRTSSTTRSRGWTLRQRGAHRVADVDRPGRAPQRGGRPLVVRPRRTVRLPASRPARSG